MLLSSILIQLAQTAIDRQRPDGSMPEGHNGPWNHVDTPVRTTAHWAIAFNKAFEVTGDLKWKVAALKCGDYLVSRAARPFQASFYCRIDHANPERQNNGLIGQAWALEALVELGRKYEKEEFLNVAAEVVNRHRYSYTQHGWTNLSVDGREGNFDRTINQQIWFSHMASRLHEKCPEAANAVSDFFTHLTQHIRYHLSGTICHRIDGNPGCLVLLKRWLMEVLFHRSAGVSHRQLALGYQSFILVAIFSYLRETGADRQLFPFLQRALRFSLNKAHAPLYRSNPFCYGYNVTGIELAYVAECLGDWDASSWWLHQQFASTRGAGGQYLSKNVSDLAVVSSRIYEIYRLKQDYEICV